MAYPNLPILLLLDFANIAIGLGIIFYILRIKGNFTGLQNMTRPWIVLSYAMIVFFIHYITLPIFRLFPEYGVPLEILFSLAGTAFLAIFVLALRLFFKAWRQT